LLCCAGLHTANSGELILNGFDLLGRPLQEFINDGVVFIAEDHLKGSLIPDMPLFEHFGLMGAFSERTFQPLKFEEAAKKQLIGMDIKQDWETPVKNLSKKDQMKFLFTILPKTLSLLICIDPTAGLDQETKQWVWQEIKLRAESGVGVLVYCSNPEELQHNTHHIWRNQAGEWQQPFESSLLLSSLNQSLNLTPNSIDEESYAAN
jgi:simple sugar transport system ATP-binding protein